MVVEVTVGGIAENIAENIVVIIAKHEASSKVVL